MLYSKDAAAQIRIYKNFTSRRTNSRTAPQKAAGEQKGFARRETMSGKMLREKGGVFREHEFLETVAGRLSSIADNKTLLIS